MTTVWLRHVRTDLALHRLSTGTVGTRSLLLLHGLGERTPDSLPRFAAAWPGPVWGLDFTGHGSSSRPKSGGYTAEVLLADVDHALEVLADDGPVTVLGRGLGAYVGLLAAGARAEQVAGAILTDGPGLAGGGPSQHSSSITHVRTPPPTWTHGGSGVGTVLEQEAAAYEPLVAQEPDAVGPEGPGSDGRGPEGTPDPYALAELTVDVRPADYATTYARLAVEYSPVERPITLATVAHHPWIDAVAELPGVVRERIGDALARYSA